MRKVTVCMNGTWIWRESEDGLWVIGKCLDCSQTIQWAKRRINVEPLIQRKRRDIDQYLEFGNTI